MGARSARIELRPYKLSDFPSYVRGFELRGRKRNKFDEGPVTEKFLSRANYLGRMKKQHKRGRTRECFIFGIFDRKTGAHLGGIDLWMISSALRMVNLGYYIHNHAAGRGYGSEAARLAQEIAFRQIDLLRVEASCEPQNKASARVALKAGMFPEGLRRNYPIPGGPTDLYAFGMSAMDFKKRRQR